MLNEWQSSFSLSFLFLVIRYFCWLILVCRWSSFVVKIRPSVCDLSIVLSSSEAIHCSASERCRLPNSNTKAVFQRCVWLIRTVQHRPRFCYTVPISFHGLCVVNHCYFSGLCDFLHVLKSILNLFYSDKAIFQQGKAIRGGVPVVWPQFGPGVLAQHGFARVKSWTLGERKTAGDTSVQLHLSHDEETLKVWPHKFQLTVTIRLTEHTLYQELSVNNVDDHAFDFTALYHTYFTVNDIKTTKVYWCPMIEIGRGEMSDSFCLDPVCTMSLT